MTLLLFCYTLYNLVIQTSIMKHYLLILSILFVAACNNPEKESNTTNKSSDIETPASAPDTFCYLYTDGTEQQDSFAVKLIINGNSVSGEMKYLPWQKDASTGTLKGTKKNNVVKLIWTYWQEGMETVEKVAFKLNDGKAYQQVPAFNDRGEMYLPENPEYGEVYSLVDCSVLPKRNY